MRKTLWYLSPLFLSVLAGCGGGEPTSIAPVPASFAISAGDTSTSKFDGRAVLADAIVTRQDLRNGGTTVEDLQTTYAYDAASQVLTMTIGANSKSFDLSGADPNITLRDDAASDFTGSGASGIFVQQNDLSQFANGTGTTKFLIPIKGYYSEDRNDDILRSFGVVGVQTPRSSVAQRADSATYSGGFHIENAPIGSSNPDTKTSFFGAMSVDVDFRTGQVSNGLLNVNSEAIDLNPSVTGSGSFDMSTVTINGNGFTSSLTSNVPGLTINAGSQISGKFYGNAAQELGGTIYYEGTLDGIPVQSPGFFSAHDGS